MCTRNFTSSMSTEMIRKQAEDETKTTIIITKADCPPCDCTKNSTSTWPDMEKVRTLRKCPGKFLRTLKISELCKVIYSYFGLKP